TFFAGIRDGFFIPWNCIPGTCIKLCMVCSSGGIGWDRLLYLSSGIFTCGFFGLWRETKLGSVHFPDWWAHRYSNGALIDCVHCIAPCTNIYSLVFSICDCCKIDTVICGQMV